LLGGGAPAPAAQAPQQQRQSPAAAAGGLGGFGASSPTSSATAEEPLRVVLDPSAGKGLQLRSRVVRRNGQPQLELVFDNQSSNTLQQFALKFNDNFIGVAPPAGPVQVGAIAPGQSKQHVLPLSDSGRVGNTQLPGVIQVAIKTELGVFYFNQPFPVSAAFDEGGRLADQQFLQLWKSLPDSNEINQPLAGARGAGAQTVDEIKARLDARNIFYIAARTVNKQTNAQACYFSARCKGQVLLIEIKIEGPATHLCVKAQDTTYAQLTLQAVAQLLQ